MSPLTKRKVLQFTVTCCALCKILVVCRCLMSPCGCIINKRLVRHNTASMTVLYGLHCLFPFHMQLCWNQYSCHFPSASDASAVSAPLMCQTLVTNTSKFQLLTNSFLLKGAISLHCKSAAPCDCTIPRRGWAK